MSPCDTIQRPRSRLQPTPTPKQQHVNSDNRYNREHESPQHDNSSHTQANSSTTTQYDIGYGSTIRRTLRLLGGGPNEQRAHLDEPRDKEAKTDITIEDHLQEVRPYMQITLETHSKTTQNDFRKQLRITLEPNARATQDHLSNQQYTSLTRIDGVNQVQFKTTEQRLDQLQQTMHATPNDIEQDAERSTRAVVTEFTPDTTEATLKKFLQDVLQHALLAGQVTHANPLHRRPTHVFLMFTNTWEEGAPDPSNFMRTSDGKNKTF